MGSEARRRRESVERRESIEGIEWSGVCTVQHARKQGDGVTVTGTVTVTEAEDRKDEGALSR